MSIRGVIILEVLCNHFHKSSIKYSVFILTWLIFKIHKCLTRAISAPWSIATMEMILIFIDLLQCGVSYRYFLNKVCFKPATILTDEWDQSACRNANNNSFTIYSAIRLSSHTNNHCVQFTSTQNTRGHMCGILKSQSLPSLPWVGVIKAPFVNESVKKIVRFFESSLYFFIFDGCHCSWIAATYVKYEWYSVENLRFDKGEKAPKLRKGWNCFEEPTQNLQMEKRWRTL